MQIYLKYGKIRNKDLNELGGRGMQLYAIRFGENFKYATKETILKNTSNPQEVVSDFPFLFYVAKNEGKTILFDVGFRDEELAQNMGITLFDVRKELEEINSTPSEVDVVVITHSHWDHIRNLDLYPRAKIYISKQEYDIALKEEPEAVKKALLSQDTVIIEKEMIIEEKFRFKVIGGHTPGSSVIYFEDKETQYVLTGDECYVSGNMLENMPIGICFDENKNKAFLEEGFQNGYLPLPFHDAGIIKNYPHVSVNVVQII